MNLTTTHVAHDWKAAYSDVQKFLRAHATPLATMKLGRGISNIYTADVLNLREQFKASMAAKPKPDLRAAAAEMRAKLATKRKGMAAEIVSLQNRVAMLERVLLASHSGHD